MGRANDIGQYFERLTKKGTGGRRTDEAKPPVTDRARDIVAKGREVVKRTTGRKRPVEPAPDVDVVVVEYSPAIDGDPDPGDVVWSWVPYEEDPSQGKDRPVVVIGRRGAQLVGIPLTTKADDREMQVEVGTGDWDPKRRTSYARIWRMVDVDAAGMRREGAVLPRDRFDRVIAAVERHYDIRRAPTSSSTTSRRPAGTRDDYDY
jgi:hypothetical protein